jgi:hypothetical protein
MSRAFVSDVTDFVGVKTVGTTQGVISNRAAKPAFS